VALSNTIIDENLKLVTDSVKNKIFSVHGGSSTSQTHLWLFSTRTLHFHAVSQPSLWFPCDITWVAAKRSKRSDGLHRAQVQNDKSKAWGLTWKKSSPHANKTTMKLRDVLENSSIWALSLGSQRIDTKFWNCKIWKPERNDYNWQAYLTAICDDHSHKQGNY